MGNEKGDLTSLLADQHFFLNKLGNPTVDHRQLSYTVNGLGYSIAARAFVRADYALHVVAKCDGTDIDAVANEVLSKILVSIKPS